MLQGLRSGPNPAAWGGNLDALFPRIGKLRPTVHHPALSVVDMPGVVAKLKAMVTDDDVAAAAVLFQALTSCRPGEARGLRWEEIDRANALWLLPANRHKTSKPWRCPLPKPVLSLLDRLARLIVPGDPSAALVFPGRKSGQPVSLTAMQRRFHEAGAKAATLHGNRSVFADFCHTKTNAKKTAIDHQLGHGPRGTTAAYWRDDMLAARAPLMTRWAAYCHG
jgi:integrase